jgi:hypothetical protein
MTARNSGIEAATKRLSLALDALDASVERRQEADRSEHALADQLQAAATDRSRLTAELDAAAARARRLEQTNRDIAERLNQAIESVRAVLGKPT